MRFDKRKYWTLLPPFLLISILIIVYLPRNSKSSMIYFLVPLTFWIVYYTWIYVEKRLMEKKKKMYVLVDDHKE